MTSEFKPGWLLKQLKAASKTVATWSKTKQEAMRLNKCQD